MSDTRITRRGNRPSHGRTLRRVGACAVTLLWLTTLPAAATAQAGAATGEDAPRAVQTLPGAYLAATVAGANRDTRAAAHYFREALRRDPRDAALIQKGFVALLADGDLDGAARLAEKIVARDARDGLAQLALAARHIRAGRHQTARRHLTQGGRGRAADVTATLLTAWSWLGSGDAEKAIATVDRLQGEDSYTSLRNYHAALIADLAGDVAQARRRFRDAHRDEPSMARLVDARARFEALRGDVEEAKRLLKEFDAHTPRHPVIRGALAAIDAGAPARSVTSARDGAAEALYGLAAAGGRHGDDMAAIIYLRLALALNPANDIAAIALADIFERARQYDRAIDVYAAIPETSALKPTAELQIGLDLELAGRSDEAIAHLARVSATRPGDVDAIIALADVHRARKNFSEAAELYTRAINSLPTIDRGRWSLFYYRGVAHERLKNWPKAEADLLRALELRPDEPNVLNYLGYSWIDQGIRLEEGFKMLRRAVDLRPKDGYIVDSLGWAYFRLGRYEDAVRELERAVELRPNDPTINDHLGDAYWKVGRRLEARFQWTHARDLKPEPEDLEKILRKLADGLPDEPAPAAADAVEPKPNGG